MITKQNKSKGLFFYQNWMAGLSEVENGFLGFIFAKDSGELIAKTLFNNEDEALRILNQTPWEYVPLGCQGCGSKSCIDCGKCF